MKRRGFAILSAAVLIAGVAAAASSCSGTAKAFHRVDDRIHTGMSAAEFDQILAAAPKSVTIYREPERVVIRCEYHDNLLILKSEITTVTIKDKVVTDVSRKSYLTGP